MLPRFLTIARTEVRQYRKSYFEQFFIFAGILLIFFMVSGSDQGLADVPSSWKLYKVGYVGESLSNISHYSVQMIEQKDLMSGLENLDALQIDVLLEEESKGEVSYYTGSSKRSRSALKRTLQVLASEKMDRIFALADSNDSLDGILFPIKVRVQEFQINYDNVIEGEIYLHRIRYINRESVNNDFESGRVNILDQNDVRRLNLTEYVFVASALAEPSDEEDVGFTLPQEWDTPFVFTSIYNNMAVLSVSILLSILLTLSLARERVNQTITTLFQTPVSRIDILLGKSLPYLALMLLTNMLYGLWENDVWTALKVFFVFSTLSITLSSFALFTVLISKNYREITFTGSLSLLTFMMFIILPNIFSGINVLAFISPLDTITSLQNNATVTYLEILLAMLPYNFLALFFISFTHTCFDPETFDHPPSLLELARRFYSRLSKAIGSNIQYVGFSVSILVPFVFILQSLMAYIILPLGYLAPYASIFGLAFLEEIVKAAPYVFRRKMNPVIYGLLAGLSFFITEKLFNIYLISKVYSYLPAPYTFFVLKGLAYTLVIHIITTTVTVSIIHRFKGQKPAITLGLILSALIHFTYNLYMMRGGFI